MALDVRDEPDEHPCRPGERRGTTERSSEGEERGEDDQHACSALGRDDRGEGIALRPSVSHGQRTTRMPVASLAWSTDPRFVPLSPMVAM